MVVRTGWYGTCWVLSTVAWPTCVSLVTAGTVTTITLLLWEQEWLHWNAPARQHWWHWCESSAVQPGSLSWKDPCSFCHDRRLDREKVAWPVIHSGTIPADKQSTAPCWLLASGWDIDMQEGDCWASRLLVLWGGSVCRCEACRALSRP